MLNDFGKLAIAEIIFYIPVLLISLAVTLKHGFDRKLGWILLFTFALIRIVGATLLIVSETQSNPSSGLLTAAGIVQSLGLSPLLLATLGFLTKLVLHVYPSISRPLHLIHLLVVAGVVLAIIGGMDATPDNSKSDQDSGRSKVKIGTILFLLAYLAMAGLHALLWSARLKLTAAQEKLHNFLLIGFPFLGIRVLYSILSAFTASSSGPSKFSSVSGDWKIYLFMALCMEYIVSWVYILGGWFSPKDEPEQTSTYKLSGRNSEEAGIAGIPLYR